MAGHLHIFRRNVVNSSPFYQVTYSMEDYTYSKVVDGVAGLTEFLVDDVGIEDVVMDDILTQLNTGSATVGGVVITESEAAAMGMTKAPTDI